MRKLNRLTMTLALLITAVGGAWAQSTLDVVEFEVPKAWENDNSNATAGDLPGFKASTYDKAQAWTGAPAESMTLLIYAFDGDKVCYVPFFGGTAGVEAKNTFTKKDYFDQKSNNVKFYYTGEITEWPLTSQDGKQWTLAKMPASNIELQVEYYAESNLFLSKDALADKASIAVTAGELGVQFGEDGKSANTITEGTAMTVKYNGTKKILGMKVGKNNDALSTALTIEAITAGTIVVNNPKDGMKYKLNGVDKGAVTSTAINVSKDDKVQFYGTATSYNGTQFAGTAEVKVYGNIMSLVSADFADNKVLTAENAFANLFKNYANLKDASALLLPATTLTTYCYGSMFMGCSNLTAAPKLPATTLANDCYWRMFKDCTSLKEVYVKAAYVSGPCTSMFFGCSAADAMLHTTSDNKASWTGNVPGNWTIDEGWTD